MLRLALILTLAFTSPLLAQEQGIEDAIRGQTQAAPSQVEAESAEVGHGFAHHVQEALATNRSRREVYAQLSDGVSLEGSRKLILAEKLTLVMAWWFDSRAKRFNERGVGLVRDDFIALDALPPPETPPRFRGRATQAQAKQVCDLLTVYRDELKGHLIRGDFLAAAERTRVALAEVLALEESMGVHWAMTVHILEQTGYASERAADYVAAEPEASRLAKHFLRTLAWGVRTAPALDRVAQKSHQLGVGFLVNDLPRIPFEVE